MDRSLRSTLRERLLRRSVLLALLTPMALLAGVAVFAEPHPASLLTPVFGPWAGTLYGHWECTMANALPGWSLGAVAFGVVTGAVVVLPGETSRRARALGVLLAATWSLVWCGLAGMSVLNTLS